MKMKHVIGALAIFMVAATAAQASIWVKYDNVKPGGTVGGWSAGVYNLQVEWNGGATAPSSGTATPSFCVDVTDNSTPAWKVYTLVELAEAPDGGPMGDARAKDITQLFRLAYDPTELGADWKTKFDGDTTVDQYAAAVQGAVWEIINETGANGYRMGLDTWTANGNAAIEAQAKEWLDLINTDNTDTSDDLPVYDNLKVLVSSDFQDFAVVRKTAEPVPEPLTMASAFFAIGGLGAYIRRRTGRAAA
jgi:hypothetical protein